MAECVRVYNVVARKERPEVFGTTMFERLNHYDFSVVVLIFNYSDEIL